MNDEKKIKLVGDRKIFTNEDLNYTCIEIFNSDDIKNFFTIKPFEEKTSYSKEQDIFTIQYNNNEISFLPGKIISINDKIIINNAISEIECYGSPIIRKYNNSIIGLNFDRDKMNYLNNLGETFDSILNDISSGKYSVEKKENESINRDEKNIDKYIDNIINQIYTNKKNEIYCIYNKTGNKIRLMYDYKYDHGYDSFSFRDRRETFKKTQNMINAQNIELFVNQRKIKFNFIYNSEEIGEIKIKFKFNKLLTSTSQMFYECNSLKSIDLSSFNFKEVNDMSHMFQYCNSLESFNLIYKDIHRIKYLNNMFYGCKKLKAVNFNLSSSYGLILLNNMFCGCLSLEILDLSSFRGQTVSSLENMFYNCSSLKVLDLSSFDSMNVYNLNHMFHNCTSLKKKKILN